MTRHGRFQLHCCPFELLAAPRAGAGKTLALNRIYYPLALSSGKILESLRAHKARRPGKEALSIPK
jgi:hypothetical protein